jgi:hypothetical protein
MKRCRASLAVNVASIFSIWRNWEILRDTWVLCFHERVLTFVLQRRNVDSTNGSGVIGLMLLMICLWLFPSLFKFLGGIILWREYFINCYKTSFCCGGMLCDLWIITMMTSGLLREKLWSHSLQPIEYRFGILEKSVIHPVFTYPWASFHPLTPLLVVSVK